MRPTEGLLRGEVAEIPIGGWYIYPELSVGVDEERELAPAYGLKPHDLRLAFGTRYLQENPGQLSELAELMGHSNLS